MALKDGQVLFEHYQYERKPEHRFTSFSMAKTVVGMAIGIAVAEGHIKSIDDPVERYEPALADSAWKGVSVRHVLNMASGVRFDETYERSDSDIAKLSRPWTRHEGKFVDMLKTYHERDAAPGERFKYISADTQVLGLVLARATGRTVAQYVGEKIWTPMGAEDDGLWVLDTAGVEAAYCCLSARLRDWARFGQLLLEHGQRNGASIIPRDWVDAATHVRAADAAFVARHRHPLPGLRLPDLAVSRASRLRAARHPRPGGLRAPGSQPGAGADRRVAAGERSRAGAPARQLLARAGARRRRALSPRATLSAR